MSPAQILLSHIFRINLFLLFSNWLRMLTVGKYISCHASFMFHSIPGNCADLEMRSSTFLFLESSCYIKFPIMFHLIVLTCGSTNVLKMFPKIAIELFFWVISKLSNGSAFTFTCPISLFTFTFHFYFLPR